MNVITLITHSDLLKTQEERDRAIAAASKASGSATNATYLIKNYIDEALPRSVLALLLLITYLFCRDPSTELDCFNALQHTLSEGERYIKLHKQNEASEALQNKN